MLKIAFFFSFLSFHGLFASVGLDENKALECLNRLNNFKTNHILFEYINFENVCSCDEISVFHLRLFSHSIETGIIYSNMYNGFINSVHQGTYGKQEYLKEEALRSFFLKNPFDEKNSSLYKTVDELCTSIDNFINNKFKTPFSTPELKKSLLNNNPTLALKYGWHRNLNFLQVPVRDYCREFLSVAKLHPICSSATPFGGIGGGNGVGQRKQLAPQINETKPKEEGLH